MPFKVPADIVVKLKNEFPETDIDKFIQSLFSKILEKTTEDASCSVREFGTFLSFKKFSKKLGRLVIRFKFKPSASLLHKIRDDRYLLAHLPLEMPAKFDKVNKFKCENNALVSRQDSRRIEREAGHLGKERTKQKMAQIEQENTCPK